MFGESDSESPRVPSPWDCLISAPPSPASPAARAHNLTESIPKLVPEAEEGNVEYKLQLLDPSPARFARLVTQMKWRLLEGGGQAYYELGVADTGALVGLPRAELDQSLETLEMMAGEIGASVIVVKEVEVPAAMAGLAGSETDYWNGKRRRRRPVYQSDVSEGDSTMESEVEILSSRLMGLDVGADVYSGSFPNSNPSATDGPDARENHQITDDTLPSAPSTDLEIASVFKPLSMRKRTHSQLSTNKSAVPIAPHASHIPPSLDSRDKPTAKGPYDRPSSASDDLNTHPWPSSKFPCGDSVTQTKQEAKLVHRNQARDRKRAAKQKGLPVREVVNPGEDDATTTVHKHLTCSPTKPNEVSRCNPTLKLTHVSIPDAHETSETVQSIPVLRLENDTFAVDPEGTDSPSPNTCSPTPNEPRLIIEALIVRKMSLEDAFLDFSGFSLT